MAIDFPLDRLLDEQAAYDRLVELLHPGGLCCPRCRAGGDRLRVHRRGRAPVLDWRCAACGRVFNALAATPWQGTHKRPSQLLLLLRGFAQGTPTARLARELSLSRGHLLAVRHRVQARADAAGAAATGPPLPGAVLEVDEMYQNAGEKRRPSRRPGRPATPPRQPLSRPRHVGPRPAAGARHRQP